MGGRVKRPHGEPPKGDPAYRQLWRLVDGAVAMAFDHHPDYLTPKGRMSARPSITKRVTGLVHSYATQVAQSRSGFSPAAVKAAGLQSPAPRAEFVKVGPDCGLYGWQSTVGDQPKSPTALPIHGWL